MVSKDNFSEIERGPEGSGPSWKCMDDSSWKCMRSQNVVGRLGRRKKEEGKLW